MPGIPGKRYSGQSGWQGPEQDLGVTSMSEITEQDIETARKRWGDALVAISTAYDNEGIESATRLAEEALDGAYGYDLGPVLFKPTMAGGEQTFRTTREGALSYFVGHNDNYPQDSGFGLKSWRQVDSTTGTSIIEGDMALWMGNVVFTDKDGAVTMVDKSWGYKRDRSGALRIVLHHSSLPYDPG
tara:strand:+ start:433 stop:990 length:558 start_codon:yes stop_codon:yes gene_type:complete